MAFFSLLKQSASVDSQIARAYQFFCRKLEGPDSDGNPLNLERFLDTLRCRVSVVSIHLGESDDSYLIFESLNAKGAPLTRADLIRNYLLLRLHANDQQQAYEQSWLPMQTLLGDNLTEFMRQFLMLNGDEVAKSAMYAVLKKRLASTPDSEVAAVLRRMQGASALYSQIVGSSFPASEIGERLARLRRWDVATANTFILKLLEMMSLGKTSPADVAVCLEIIESFVIRRIVCGVPTNQLKRIFLSAAKDMPSSSDVGAWLRPYLAGGGAGRRWPKDEEFKEALSRYRVYSQQSRCRFILEAIESCFEHKEPVRLEATTIEHIMPQTLTDEWRGALGPNAREIHERWLDVLTNLTLTGYNSELSNSPFERKRALLAESHIEMNRWVAARPHWGLEELEERSVLLFEAARKIWPRPAEL